ncbi:MAG: saccharopine dehydrogenase NADP-binding domain-containing protein [Alcanivorax sp.]|nr:saccharopine dehydrogenase NADP-binding domain-containing protein [Alcanivorax sp.]
MRWMIYGANGYTGELLARAARGRGLRPILAGRSEARIAPLAEQEGLPYRCFALDDVETVAEQLADVDLVIHCAGPFSKTSAAMLEACLEAHTHYLDITGEVAVFEHAHGQNERARSAGIIVCPGVGFDVIPTDCVAAKLKELLPDATDLSLGFSTRSGLSPGTAKTTIEGLALGGRARIDEQLREVPLGWKVRRIDFGQGPEWAMTIPWGDVSTAWHTTAIANIQVYLPAPRWFIWAAKAGNLARPLLGKHAVQHFLMSMVDRRVKGPGESVRASLPTYVWGEACTRKQTVTVRIKTANVYSLTVDGALAVRDYIEAHRPAPGTYTPALLCGTDLVETLPGSGRFEIS